MIAFGMLRDDSWHVRLIKVAMRALYRRLDHIIVIGRDMADIIRDKLAGVVVPISVVTNWADEDVVQPVAKERSARLANLGWTDKFIVQYAGNMGRPNAIELVLDAATLLRDDPRIRFMFVGSGAKRPWLEREVERRKLTSVRVEPPVPRNEQSELLSASDASIIPLIPGMLGLGVPSRTYNVLAAGRPLVAVSHPDSELARLVREERVGWFVPDVSDAHQLAMALRAAANLPERELLALKARARYVAVHRYARRQVIREIEKVLDSPIDGWVV
jgi:glycosyltransferase involved in cell wall biosynthesis